MLVDPHSFRWASDLIRHSVSKHQLYPHGAPFNQFYPADGTDLKEAEPDEILRYGDGTHRRKKETTDAQWEQLREEAARTKARERVKISGAAETTKQQERVIRKGEQEAARRKELEQERAKREFLEKKIEATAALMKSIQESKDKKAAREKAKKFAVVPVLEEVEVRETENLTEEGPKKPVRKMKSAVVKLGGKNLEKEIDSETGALNMLNKEANMKQMAVKLMKMGPEVNAHVAEKQGQATVKKRSPKETVVGTILETKDVLVAKEWAAIASSRDPRLKRAEIPQPLKDLEGAERGGSVEGDFSGEDDDYGVTEKEAVQLSFPNELVLA